MLGIEPGLRDMHVNTAQGISDAAHARVQAELAAAAGVARYAVSDLEYPAIFCSTEKRLLLLGPLTDDRTLLPVVLDDESRTKFPFNQRAIYRTRGGRGRYIVHELTPPLGDSPPPAKMKSLIALINKSGAANAPTDEAASEALRPQARTPSSALAPARCSGRWPRRYYLSPRLGTGSRCRN